MLFPDILKNKFILFISFWLHWVFVAACGLSLVVASGGCSSLWCAGFTSGGSRALELRLSSCGMRALLLHGMWDLPGPGLEPMSPALAGGFLTTAPPGKPYFLIFKQNRSTFITLKTNSLLKP